MGLSRSPERSAQGARLGVGPFRLPPDALALLRQGWESFESRQARLLQDVKAFHVDMEAKRQELRSLRGMESKLRWDSAREECRQRVFEEQQTAAAQQAATVVLESALQQGVAERRRTDRRADLHISKEFQEFKKEARQRSQDADRRVEQELIASYRDCQASQALLADRRASEKKTAQEYRKDVLRLLQEERMVNGIRERTQSLEEQEMERRRDVSYALRLAVAEKDRLVGEIKFMGRCRDASPVSSAARHMSTAQAQRLSVK